MGVGSKRVLFSHRVCGVGGVRRWWRSERRRGTTSSVVRRKRRTTRFSEDREFGRSSLRSARHADSRQFCRPSRTGLNNGVTRLLRARALGTALVRGTPRRCSRPTPSHAAHVHHHRGSARAGVAGRRRRVVPPSSCPIRAPGADYSGEPTVTTTLPRTWPVSTARWASAARSSGKVSAISRRMTPSTTSRASSPSCSASGRTQM